MSEYPRVSDEALASAMAYLDDGGVVWSSHLEDFKLVNHSHMSLMRDLRDARAMLAKNQKTFEHAYMAFKYHNDVIQNVPKVVYLPSKDMAKRLAEKDAEIAELRKLLAARKSGCDYGSHVCEDSKKCPFACDPPPQNDYLPKVFIDGKQITYSRGKCLTCGKLPALPGYSVCRECGDELIASLKQAEAREGV